VPGAIHWYCRVKEEDNYLWNGKRWCTPWNFPFQQRGRSFDSEPFFSPEDAVSWINGILKAEFSVETHELVDPYSANVPRPGAYLFWKDGD